MHLDKKDLNNLNTFYNIENKKLTHPHQARPGNLNRFKHGIWANRFLSEDEQGFFYAILEKLFKDFKTTSEVDKIQIQCITLELMKYFRAIKADDSDSAERFDRMMRAKFKDLKASRIMRESNDNKNIGSSPAEWIAAFMTAYKDKNETE